MRITAVFTDIGSSRELLPAVKVLRQRGHEVSVFTDWNDSPAPKKVLEPGGITDYLARKPNCDLDIPEVIIIGCATTAIEPQILWTKFGKKKNIPVLWINDLWGTSVRSVTGNVSPDIMLCLDPQDEALSKGKRPSGRTVIVGKPSFESFGQLLSQKTEIRQKVREILSIPEDALVITYSSGGESSERVQEQVSAFIDHLSGIKLNGRDFYLVSRLHPKLPLSQERKDFLLKGLLAKVTNTILGSEKVVGVIEELILASDAIMSDWNSTSLYHAALASVAPVVLLFPNDSEERVKVFPPHGNSPLITTRSGLSVTKPNCLSAVLSVATNPKSARTLANIGRESFAYTIETGAPQRIADALEEALALKAMV